MASPQEESKSQPRVRATIRVGPRREVRYQLEVVAEAKGKNTSVIVRRYLQPIRSHEIVVAEICVIVLPFPEKRDVVRDAIPQTELRVQAHIGTTT